LTSAPGESRREARGKGKLFRGLDDGRENVTMLEAGGGALRLLITLSVVALVTLTGMLVWSSVSNHEPVRKRRLVGLKGLRPYELANYRDLTRLARKQAEVIIVKGNATASQLEDARVLDPHVKLVNYEQAFALNKDEAEVARAQGWLAKTCDGREISPRKVSRATLMDATIRAAREWRAQLMAKETRRLGYDLNYLDTLRSYFPADFYDGIPCKVSGEAWLKASIDMVKLVQQKTGKEVIANGRGMQNGLQYVRNREAVDRLVATADAVQVEHFGRFHSEIGRDLKLVKAILEAGKEPYVKCRRHRQACRTILSELPGGGPIYVSIHR
jgi:hypothetical protein